MPRSIAAAVVCAVLALPAASPATAADCTPYCDFNHYYGPYDFTWVRPGLYAYPRCAPSGECQPEIVTSRRYYGRITIHSLARHPHPRY